MVRKIAAVGAALLVALVAWTGAPATAAGGTERVVAIPPTCC